MMRLRLIFIVCLVLFPMQSLAADGGYGYNHSGKCSGQLLTSRALLAEHSPSRSTGAAKTYRGRPQSGLLPSSAVRQSGKSGISNRRQDRKARDKESRRGGSRGIPIRATGKGKTEMRDEAGDTIKYLEAGAGPGRQSFSMIRSPVQ